MVLSPEARIIDGSEISQTGTTTRDILVVVQSTRTVGIGPDEFIFPDPDVIRVSPGFGLMAMKIREGQEEWWLKAEQITLSTEVVKLDMRRVNLVAVALIPENGCEMDATSLRN